VTVIDHADDGFNLSKEAVNTLTCVGFSDLIPFADAYCSDGQADLGVFDGTGVQVPNSLCGLA
jgi:hypothetical protein